MTTDVSCLWANWQRAEEGQAQAVLDRLITEFPLSLKNAALVSARVTALPFYRAHRVFELHLEVRGVLQKGFALDDGATSRLLDGRSHAIYATNDAEQLELRDETVTAYTRFYLFFLRNEDAPFTLLESADSVRLAHATEDESATPSGDERSERLRLAQSAAMPLALVGQQLTSPGAVERASSALLDEKKSSFWTLTGAMAHEGSLSSVTFNVTVHGDVKMSECTLIASLEALEIDEYPALTSGGLVYRRVPRQQSARVAGEQTESTELATGVPMDREITEAIVAVLLEDAIRQRFAHSLLGHFNGESAADPPIEVLARALESSAPILALESELPFVEEFVAGLIKRATPTPRNSRLARAQAHSSDDAQCNVPYHLDVGMLLISMHAYRSIHDLERTAHELSLHDASVLIGCARLGDVPEPLRRIVDMELRLPRFDRRIFARAFERVFGAPPTAGWDAPGADWTRYLVPPDFHVPRRLGLDVDDAVTFLRERAFTRLRAVTPDGAPNLEDLHGMAEARQVCEDLIADINAAQRGDIPWTAVDRGLLLVGRPGTGKTTLARAIAKAAGIKFVSASATRWQSMGALDSHLRAMRADFSEARRFAPAILFLDEIDSVGSRELLDGPSAQYQTEVINALLEQVQGIDPDEPVIVLAATNYEAKVDPALRRAGRFDQVVHIPLPSIPALERIFAFYLEPHRNSGLLAGDIQLRTLAELAFGVTGADVEFFCRGASRRARKESRPITQSDIAAEVTRRPRSADSAPRLASDALRRVAVHESGHALSRLLSSSAGQDITFVSIVPRLDGSLGFVASVPNHGEIVTRRTVLEQLETILAGRAAEEVVFGATGVSMGAGGRSAQSDLAVATRLATMIVCQSGINEEGSLLWAETSTAAQQGQIEALLRRAYSAVSARLESHRDVLDRVVNALVAKQELTGAELRALVAEPWSDVARGTPPDATPYL